MRKTDLIVRIMRTIGIVLLFVVAVFAIYGLSTSQSRWKEMETKLTENGVSTNVSDRVRFDMDYYAALSNASWSDTTGKVLRGAEAEAYFADFIEKAKDAESLAAAEKTARSITSLKEDFDWEDFLESFEQLEDVQARAAARQIISEIDTLLQPVSKGGKKLPTLAAASSEDGLTAYYEQLTEDNDDDDDEETGTWLEFVTAVRNILTEAKENGTSFTSIDDFLKSDSFSEDIYSDALTVIHSAEEEEENTNFLQICADFAADYVEGNQTIEDFISEQTAALQAIYPDQDLSNQAAFADAVLASLQNRSFDGSYASLLSAYQAQVQEQTSGSFSSWMQSFGQSVVEDADDRSRIPAAAYLWKGVSLSLWIFGTAILFIILSVLIRKLINRILLTRGVEDAAVDDSDVLLRVDHLKQYFRSGTYVNKAVDDVSFFIRKGEIFGLVGESGCGKTTTGRTIIGLYEPSDGRVSFHGMQISSTQNGMKVLIANLKNEAKTKIQNLKADTKDAVSKNPANKAELEAECRRQIRAIKKECNAMIDKKQLEALRSEAARNKSTELYMKMRQKELKEAYDEDMKHLSGNEAAERTRRYKTEKKAAANRNAIMTRMQMIFQDPIASIDPRMTVREIIAEGLKIRGITDKKYIDEKVYEMLNLVGLVPEHADRYPHEFSGGQRQRIGIARAIVMEPELIIADEPISALDVSIQAQVINLLNDLRDRMNLTILFIAHNLSVVKYFSDRIAVMYFGRIVEMADSDELFLHPLHPYTKSLLSAIPYPDPHYEKQRKRIEYDPAKAHDYSSEQPELREIVPGHYILCNSEEFEKYKKELSK